MHVFTGETARKPGRTLYIHLVDCRYCGIRQGRRTLYFVSFAFSSPSRTASEITPWDMLMSIPQCNCSIEFRKIPSQNLICYQRLIASGNNKIMHCGILNNMFYDDGSNKVWRAYKLTKILSPGLLHWQNSFVCKRKLN